MKIQDNKIIFEYALDPAKWWVLEENGCYWLAPMIDRSYKGKDPDVGVPEVQLSYEEAEELMRHRFARIAMNSHPTPVLVLPEDKELK